MKCPVCGAENIEGNDNCVQCGQSLADLHRLAPTNDVELALTKDPVSALSPKAPLTVPASMTVGEVLKFLVEKKIGCVMVVEDGEIVGVFTERDALRKLNVDAAAHMDKPISEFMTRGPKSLEENAKLVFAVRMMDQGGIRHILVRDGAGIPTGVCSVRDVLRYFGDHSLAQ